MIDEKHCYARAAALFETNDCVVRALAVATQIEYDAMHEYLAQHGRRTRDGMRPAQYHAALRDLGFTLRRLHGAQYALREHFVEGHERYNRRTGRWTWVDGCYRARRVKVAPGEDYSSATVTTLARELTSGTYLVGIDGHVLCLRDGVVHDYTKGRRHRVLTVHQITEG